MIMKYMRSHIEKNVAGLKPNLVILFLANRSLPVKSNSEIIIISIDNFIFGLNVYAKYNALLNLY